MSSATLNRAQPPHSWHQPQLACHFRETDVNDVGCITDIQCFMAYRPLATEIDARILRRLRLSSNSVMNFLYDIFGKHGLQARFLARN